MPPEEHAAAMLPKPCHTITYAQRDEAQHALAFARFAIHCLHFFRFGFNLRAKQSDSAYLRRALPDPRGSRYRFCPPISTRWRPKRFLVNLAGSVDQLPLNLPSSVDLNRKRSAASFIGSSKVRSLDDGEPADTRVTVEFSGFAPPILLTKQLPTCT